MTFKGILLKFKSSNRGQKRLIRAGLTGTSGLLIRGIRIGTALISVPLTAKYLGAERYGLWLILNTFLGYTSMADLGLANSLRNMLATADGQESREKARIAVSSVSGLILSVCLILGTMFWLVYPHIDWSRVFNVSSSLAKENASSAIIVIAILFLLQLVLATPLDIYDAYQEGYLSNVWAAISSIGSLVALIIAVSYHADLPILALAVFGMPLLGNFLAAMHLYFWKRPWLRPSFVYFRWSQAYSLLKLGFQFWLGQIAIIILLQTDLMVVAQLFGAVDVAKYGVSLKLFGLISAIQMTLIFPLWSAYAEAFSRQEFTWVTRTLKRSLSFSLLWTALASLVMLLFGQEFIRILTNKEAVPGIDLLLAMSLTSILTAVMQTFGIFMNGIGEVKIQAFIGPFSGIFNLAISIVFGRWIGLAGVSLGTATTVAITLIMYGYFLFRKSEKIKILINAEKL